MGDEEKQRVGGAWFPYPTLEALGSALADASKEHAELQALGSRYEAALTRHRELAVQESDALERRQF